MSDRYKGAILSPTAPTVTSQSAGGIYTLSQQTQYQGQGVWPTAVNYPINNSLRFRASAGAYLNRTPASSTNRTTWTWSAWVKRGDLVFNSDNRLFGAGTSNSNRVLIGFENYIAFVITDGTGNLSVLSTTPVYRDPSAWYHLVVAFDSTQATASNRVKIYVNGSQVTAFSTATYPPQNTVTPINSTDSHVIGTRGYTLDSFYDGYMAEVNFIDGVQLTPSSFGTTDAYGIWQPIPYTGAYGTNGFYLPFNPGATLSASYLVVAGGGGGGAGGAGAGGLLTGVTTLASAASYTVTVGAGGAIGNLTTTGGNGGNSVFDAITATGGGGGAGGGGATAGASGGSGGGGTNNGAGGAGTSGQGFAGGAGYTDNASYGLGGGGGGAGAVGGSAASGAAGGNGGVGISSSISGTATFYAGGGGGGGGGSGTYPAGTGGNGGGGNGNSNGSGSNATANTGGGGGGAGSTGSGGLGGSGIVIVSYPGSARFTGGTITTSGGNTIHTFTSSGTLAGTSTAITNDYSGNGNNWTPNNISLTAGSTYDSMKDVPTNTNSNTANYCVLNPLDTSVLAMSNGNLQASSSTASWNTTRATVGITSGKFYWEYQTSSNNSAMVGIETQSASLTTYIGNNATGYAYNANDGQKYNNGSGAAYGATYGNGDIIGVAFDADSRTLTFYKNNTSQGTAFSSILAGTYFPSVSINASAGAVTNNINFGQQPFSYTPPTGFLPLNTYNLPTPTILDGDQYFNPVLYTGNGGTQTVSGVGFQPDLVWIKNRGAGNNNVLNDVLRGAGYTLYSDDTASESNLTSYFTGFNSDGFSLALGGGAFNAAYNYVSWNWKANGAGVSNTQGTITSTVSVNTTAGFSIATFTSPSSGTASFGHGLGVTPSFVIVKSRASGNWICQHTSTGTQYLLLNGTGAATTDSIVWNSAFTSTVVNIGTGFSGTVNYVAYCFSAVAGYSAFGSYTGNGSADGPFIFTGFRPRFVLYKNSSNGSAFWRIWDSSRSPSNEVNAALFPNSSNAEDVGGAGPLDFLSNGFKIRTSQTNDNGSGNTFIYMAFAENPFKIARGR